MSIIHINILSDNSFYVHLFLLRTVLHLLEHECAIQGIGCNQKEKKQKEKNREKKRETFGNTLAKIIIETNNLPSTFGVRSVIS